MARQLALTARQVTAICKGAAKAGFVAEVQIGDVTVRLVPQKDSGSVSDGTPATFTTLEQYEKWRNTRPKGYL